MRGVTSKELPSFRMLVPLVNVQNTPRLGVNPRTDLRLEVGEIA